MAGDQKKPVSPPKFPPKNPTQFIVDEKTGSDLHTMPSITRLLNRKKVETQKPTPLSITSEPELKVNEVDEVHEETHPPIVFDLSEFGIESSSEPPVSIETLAVNYEAMEVLNSNSSFEHVTTSPSSSDLSGLSLSLSFSDEEVSEKEIQVEVSQSVVTKPAKLRVTASPQLHFWDSKILKNTKDPLAEGITLLLKNGAISTLFMALVSPSAQSPVPFFEARAIAGSKNKENIWTGMKWNPAIVPHVWNSFIHPGLIELSPPGTQTDQMSQRNVMRGALGLRMDEFLVLVRIGPENACRGALVIISKQSLIPTIEAAMRLFSQKAPDITLAA